MSNPAIDVVASIETTPQARTMSIRTVQIKISVKSFTVSHSKRLWPRAMACRTVPQLYSVAAAEAMNTPRIIEPQN